MSGDAEDVRAELTGAPPELQDLQAIAQQLHETLLSDELEVVFGHAGVTATWRRGVRIEGAGPTPAYYYDFVGSAIASFADGT